MITFDNMFSKLVKAYTKSLHQVLVKAHTKFLLTYYHCQTCMFFVCLHHAFIIAFLIGLIRDNHNHQLVTCLNKQITLECNQVSWDDLDLPTTILQLTRVYLPECVPS